MTRYDDIARRDLDDRDPAGVEMRRLADWIERVPPRFWEAELSTLPEPQRATVTEWVYGWPDAGLVIAGPIGTGKTWAGFAALRARFMAGATVAWTSTPLLLDDLRPDGPATLEDYIAPHLLLLDDYGSHRVTEWATERLFALANARWEARRPTVITTNMAADALREARRTDRVLSRLTDGAVAVRFTGESRRQPGQWRAVP